MVAPTSGGPVRRLASIAGGASWASNSRGLFMDGSFGTDISQLWFVAVDGSSPVPLGISGEVHVGAVSPRNDSIAFDQSRATTEVRLYKNLIPASQQ